MCTFERAMPRLPEIKAKRAELKPSVWHPRPIPQPAPERRTADPKTPTAKELAARAQQRASLTAAPTSGSASAAPSKPDVPALAPAQCGGAWDTINAEVAQSLGEPAPAPGQPLSPPKGVDLVDRNRKVTAAYAQLYLDDPRFQWAGAAAFASKQVGCGMQDARALARGQSWDPRTARAAHAERVLGKGNGAVFADIYPTHKFYQRFGSKNLTTCGSSRPGGPLPRSLGEAFERLENHDGHPTEQDFRTSAQLIIGHEQTDILQPGVFDDPEFAQTLWASQQGRQVFGSLAEWGGARPVNVAISASCSGSTSYEFTGSDPAKLQQRLPFARAVVDAFGDTVEGAGRASTETELGKLATGVWRYGRGS